MFLLVIFAIGWLLWWHDKDNFARTDRQSQYVKPEKHHVLVAVAHVGIGKHIC